MTTSGLASPPRAARPRVSPPEPRPPPRTRNRSDYRDTFRRVLGWSLAASVLAHALLLLISPFVIRVEAPTEVIASAPPAPSGAFGLQMIVAIPSANAPEIPAVEDPSGDLPSSQPPAADQPAGEVAGETPGEAPGAESAPSTSARDALQPGYRDPRLYVSPPMFPDLDRTDHERYMEHLQARIDAINDSMIVAANRERRTSDWTVTDGSGNRWGLSPEGLHLGGVTLPRAIIPLPRATGDNQRLEEERERLRRRDEIRRQENDRARARTEAERIRAMREAEEARRNRDGN